jgi:SagB-type dehydrogenase family enzyme
MNLTNPPLRRATPRPSRPLNTNVRSVVQLPAPSGASGPSFWSTLQTRRTRYGTKQLRLAELSDVLHEACRIVEGTGGKRPWPSAGAVYPIELLVEGIQGGLEGLFRYRPETHVLEEMDTEPAMNSQLRGLAAHCLPVPPATLLWLAACSERTSACYENAESLVWRDSGGLLATLGLVAHALGLQAATVGVTGEPLISTTVWSMSMHGVGAINLALPDGVR